MPFSRVRQRSMVPLDRPAPGLLTVPVLGFAMDDLRMGIDQALSQQRTSVAGPSTLPPRA